MLSSQARSKVVRVGVLAVILCALTLSACGTTPTPVPVAVAPTATEADTATATSTPTATATALPSATATDTPPPTDTHTSIPTSTSTSTIQATVPVTEESTPVPGAEDLVFRVAQVEYNGETIDVLGPTSYSWLYRGASEERIDVPKYCIEYDDIHPGKVKVVLAQPDPNWESVFFFMKGLAPGVENPNPEHEPILWEDDYGHRIVGDYKAYGWEGYLYLDPFRYNLGAGSSWAVYALSPTGHLAGAAVIINLADTCD